MPSKKNQNNPNVVVREYTEDQKNQVHSLILSIFEIELQDIPSSGYLNDIHSIHSVYGGERNRFWTASVGKRVVGTLAVKEDSEDEVMVRRFFVSPAYRDQGIGRMLFKEAFEFARKAGYQKMVFIGNSRMHKARKALLKYDFKEIEEINIGEIQIFRSELEL